MRDNKKFLIIAVLTVVVFGLVIAGVTIPLLYQKQAIEAPVEIINEVIESEPQMELLEDSAVSATLQDINKEIIQKELEKKIMTFAVFGTDERESEQSRSDIIMVLKYFPATETIRILSIPRDTRVEIPEHGLDKINHAFAFGGPELSCQTIEDLLGIQLDFYYKVGFDDFANLIDQVGGVEVLVEKDFYDDDVKVIDEGLQLLDGYKALYYVRFRHDADGDYGRIERQQRVSIAVVQKLLEMDYDDAKQLLLNLFESQVKTDMTLVEYKKVIGSLEYQTPLNFEQSSLKTHSAKIDGIWYELYEEQDLKSAQELFEE